jgi:hypothetical protein
MDQSHARLISRGRHVTNAGERRGRRGECAYELAPIHHALIMPSSCHRAQAAAPILDYLLRTKGTLPLGCSCPISTFLPFCVWLLPVEADTESLGGPPRSAGTRLSYG